MQAFGRYYITDSQQGDLAGAEDMQDYEVLRVTKNWSTQDWLSWNTRNTAIVADQ